MINILECIWINIKCLFCHIKIYEITISGQEQAGSLSFMMHHEKGSILCSVWSQHLSGLAVEDVDHGHDRNHFSFTAGEEQK